MGSGVEDTSELLVQTIGTPTKTIQNQQNELRYPQFAFIYIDYDGNVRHEASQSIARSCETIQSPRVTDGFL